MDSSWLAGWLAGWLTGRLVGCLAAWLVGPWLADRMKVWPCGRPADGPVARCPRASGCLVACCQTGRPARLAGCSPADTTPPGIRCEIMCPPCHPLQMSDNWTQRERERENAKGKGKRMERERKDAERCAWQEARGA